jgi:hypothetical protein
MVRFMIAHPCFLHAHALGQTFFIEQKAGIVAAHVDKSAKRIAKAQDEKRHRIHAKADFGVALLCAQISILGDAHALGDGKDCEPTFPPRGRQVAAEFGQRPLDGGGQRHLIHSISFIRLHI